MDIQDSHFPFDSGPDNLGEAMAGGGEDNGESEEKLHMRSQGEEGGSENGEGEEEHEAEDSDERDLVAKLNPGRKTS